MVGEISTWADEIFVASGSLIELNMKDKYNIL